MCYYVSKPDKPKLADYFKKKQFHISNFELGAYFPSDIESGFAHKLLAITTAEDMETVRTGIWGLVPYWTRTSQEAKSMARSFFLVSNKYF